VVPTRAGTLLVDDCRQPRLIAACVYAPLRVPSLSVTAICAYPVIANYGMAREARIGASVSEHECGRVAAEYLRMSPGTFVVIADTRRSKVASIFWIPTTPVRTFTALPSDPPVDLAAALEIADFAVVNGAPNLLDHGIQPKVSVGARGVYGKPG